MDSAVTVAIVASIPSSLAVIIGLLNRRSVTGKDGLNAEVRANTAKLDEFRRWAEKHDWDHLIHENEETQLLRRRIDKLEEK